MVDLAWWRLFFFLMVVVLVPFKLITGDIFEPELVLIPLLLFVGSILIKSKST